MQTTTLKEDEITCALIDSGMSRDMIDEFLGYFYLGQKEEEKRMLQLLRSKVLSDIHIGQNKLYCLDYLINELKLK